MQSSTSKRRCKQPILLFYIPRQESLIIPVHLLSIFGLAHSNSSILTTKPSTENQRRRASYNPIGKAVSLGAHGGILLWRSNKSSKNTNRRSRLVSSRTYTCKSLLLSVRACVLECRVVLATCCHALHAPSELTRSLPSPRPQQRGYGSDEEP